MKARTQKLRKVTRLPKWVLRLMGKLDAKQGVSVVDAHIALWLDRLGAFENDLVKAEEKAVLPVREKAALAVSALERAKADLSVPAIVSADKPKPTDPKLIRAVRNAQEKAEGRRNNAESLHKASTEELISCNELIISSNVKIRERIEAMRNTAKASIDAYVKGVRKVFPDFSPQVTFSDYALEIYLSPHSALDAKVKEVAYAYNTKEVC